MSNTQKAVEAAISEALRGSDEMVTRWVLCAEAVDADGRRGLWLLTNDDAKAWDTIGMLGYALQCEQARGVKNYLDEPD